MKTNKPDWENRLKAHLGEDRERFPLPDGHFDSLKESILANKSTQVETAKPKGSLRLIWSIAVPVAAAAALAFFVLNRQTVPVSPLEEPVLLSEAAEVFLENTTEEIQVLEIDSQVIHAISGESEYENMKEEVIYEDYLDDYMYETADASDPLADITADEIEDYLVENININSEL